MKKLLDKLPVHLCHRCAHAALACLYLALLLDLMHGGAAYGAAAVAYTLLAVRP